MANAIGLSRTKDGKMEYVLYSTGCGCCDEPEKVTIKKLNALTDDLWEQLDMLDQARKQLNAKP